MESASQKHQRSNAAPCEFARQSIPSRNLQRSTGVRTSFVLRQDYRLGGGPLLWKALARSRRRDGAPKSTAHERGRDLRRAKSPPCPPSSERAAATCRAKVSVRIGHAYPGGYMQRRLPLARSNRTSIGKMVRRQKSHASGGASHRPGPLLRCEKPRGQLWKRAVRDTESCPGNLLRSQFQRAFASEIRNGLRWGSRCLHRCSRLTLRADPRESLWSG